MKAKEAISQIQHLISLALENKRSEGKKISRSIRLDEALDREVDEAMAATGADRTEIIEQCVAMSIAQVALQILSKREEGREKLLAKLTEKPVKEHPGQKAPNVSSVEDRESAKPKESRRTRGRKLGGQQT